MSRAWACSRGVDRCYATPRFWNLVRRDAAGRSKELREQEMRNSVVRWALPRKDSNAAHFRCRFRRAGRRTHQGIPLQAIQMEHLSEAWIGGNYHGRAGEQFPLFFAARRSWRREWPMAWTAKLFAVSLHSRMHGDDCGDCAAGDCFVDFYFLPDHALAVCILSFPHSQHEGDWAGLAALSNAGITLLLAEHCCGNLLHGADGSVGDSVCGTALAGG